MRLRHTGRKFSCDTTTMTMAEAQGKKTAKRAEEAAGVAGAAPKANALPAPAQPPRHDSLKSGPFAQQTTQSSTGSRKGLFGAPLSGQVQYQFNAGPNGLAAPKAAPGPSVKKPVTKDQAMQKKPKQKSKQNSVRQPADAKDLKIEELSRKIDELQKQMAAGRAATRDTAAAEAAGRERDMGGYGFPAYPAQTQPAQFGQSPYAHFPGAQEQAAGAHPWPSDPPPQQSAYHLPFFPPPNPLPHGLHYPNSYGQQDHQAPYQPTFAAMPNMDGMAGAPFDNQAVPYNHGQQQFAQHQAQPCAGQGHQHTVQGIPEHAHAGGLPMPPHATAHGAPGTNFLRAPPHVQTSDALDTAPHPQQMQAEVPRPAHPVGQGRGQRIDSSSLANPTPKEERADVDLSRSQGSSVKSGAV
ncbi:uncharacterized protein LTR77_005053 [Saxophila tyrrhenica]|uniref:Uncharacterized protein n=1 Tax=Saxophila tyrrhenica TaxID=1690608 RepID=A0AAV9PE42_9PEZI|nr:hypothetical protein LTR77_005053 [Saxophila tyrrhenica]